jgi:hypothetical protein
LKSPVVNDYTITNKASLSIYTSMNSLNPL